MLDFLRARRLPRLGLDDFRLADFLRERLPPDDGLSIVSDSTCVDGSTFATSFIGFNSIFILSKISLFKFAAIILSFFKDFLSDSYS